MKKNKKWIVLALGIVLCLALQACAPQGPAVYGINSVWEVDDSSFSITDVKAADSYTLDSGETVTPDAGYRFLVITAQLSGETKVAQMRLKHSETGFEANWPKGPFDRDGRTVYVFSVRKSLTEDEAIGRLQVDVTLQVGANKHTGSFQLYERK